MTVDSYNFRDNARVASDRTATATIHCCEAVRPGASRALFRVLRALDFALGQFTQRDDLQRLVLYLGPMPATSLPPGVAPLTEAKRGLKSDDHPIRVNDLALNQCIVRVRRKLANFQCPTVAAFDSACSGLLADLAAWCDCRVATNRLGTTLEYPYSRLGLSSPLDVETRLVHLVGAGAATHLIATGQPLSARTAARIGLIDRLVSTPEQLETAAIAVTATREARAATMDRRTQSAPPGSSSEATWQLIGDHLESLLIASDHPSPETARATIARLKRTQVRDVAPMVEEPGQRPAGTTTVPVPSPLHHVYQLLRQTHDSYRRRDGEPCPAEMGSIGICGAGIMGRGIAAAALAHEIPVVLYDAAREALDTARAAVAAEFTADRALPWGAILSPANAARQLATVRTESQLDHCGLIIESVVENRELKQQILRRLEAVGGPRAILASNTSTIPITELAGVLDDPDRFCGLHFCNPVRQRQLVEIVRGEQTSRRTLLTAINYARAMSKVPIVTRDRPGFLVNRLLLAYLNESIIMLCEGVPLTIIDQAARSFGMPLGPFELLDLIGTDTAMMAGRSLWDAFPERVSVTPVLPALVKRNRLGWKTRLGFYRYQQIPGPAREDDQLTRILQPYVRPRRKENHAWDPREIITRLLLPMVLEATRVLDDEVVRTPREIDVGVIFGLAFPARRGGLCYWADQLGPRQLVEHLRRYEPLGQRMMPTDRLLQMAAARRGFYASFGY